MASTAQQLDAFVRDALAHGASRDAIEGALAAAGWPAEQVRPALSAYADLAFPVPVPRPQPYLSAREAFFYLLLFATLYLSAYHLGSLLFELVDRAWPDVAAVGYDNSAQSMRLSVASLLIAFPVFVLLARYLARELARSPAKRLSAIRRWLTYMTLFIAATVLIGDLIALAYRVLGGETSVRFLLKVLVAGVIAGSIFGYYLWDLRQEEREA